MSRYQVGVSVKLYLPAQKDKHGREVKLPGNYDGSTPATIEFTVTDQENGQKLTIHFFPLRYSYYPKYPENWLVVRQTKQE